MAFYAKHTIDSEIMEIVSEIESGRDEKWLENLLDTEIHSIENHALFLPLNEQKEAMNVAELGKWLKKIYLEREQIATSAKVRERLKIEMSIEDEFSSDPVKEAERNIQLYIQTIQTGKKKDRLADVIKEAGTPACFTGRMGAISEFLPRLQWEELDQLAIAGYTFLTADVAISEFINSSIPREVEEDDEAAGKFINDFTAEKCLADVENFATQFETYCVGKNGKTFEEFLKREGITDSIPIKDWVAVSKNLIESKFFSEILSRAKTQAKRDFFI